MNQQYLAYSPTIHLVESHAACYKIYILINPITDEIFYVGQTILSLQERLYGHLNQTGSSNREKINYIKEILNQDRKPVIKEVETIHTRCYIDKASVNERENYWIKYYRSIGCRLFNIANPKNYEYQNYLSSIKKGETSYHYYVCGKTAGGYEVYDEQKLKADGFVFRQYLQEIAEEEIDYKYHHHYNPLEYDKYRIKMGLPPLEKPGFKYITTETFPEQPAWSTEFAAGIPPYNSLKVEIFLEMQIDNCDYEPDIMELDESDFEPDFDDEPDYYENFDNSLLFLLPLELPELYYVAKPKSEIEKQLQSK